MIEIGDGDCDKSECQEALEALYLFMDKELSELKRSQVEDHLEDCVPCLKTLEFEAELKRVVANKCTEEVPAHLYERIRMSLRVEIDRADKNPS